MQYILCSVNYFIVFLHAKIKDNRVNIVTWNVGKRLISHLKMSAFFFFKMAVLLLQCNRLRITVNQKMKILCATNVMVLQPNEEYFSFNDDGNTRRNPQG